jgi:2-oxoglutarate ferredoxin oxidoreductase subunit alpha
MDVTIRIAGEAGQGVLTTGHLLVQALASVGLHVLATRSYMSRVRGGLNWYDVRIGDRPLFGPAPQVHLLVALTDVAKDVLQRDLAPKGLILHKGDSHDARVIAIDVDAVAKEVAADQLYASAVATGAVFGLLGYDLPSVERLLEQEFAAKGQDVVLANRNCLRKGAALAAVGATRPEVPQPDGQARTVYDGATAIALSAAVAGLKFATAYPMTPSTATFTFLAGVADEYGMVVEQAEDEIAAVNMVCGAAYAGVPAMTMTSGGGFALMVEGLSLAGMMELPILILIAQRPAPATGLPTRTAQQDLLFAVRAGHGEFPRAVFAPGTVRQCYEITRRALQTAQRFQTPVLILSDQFLQDMEQSGEELDATPQPIDRCIAADASEDYIRYRVTESGISPRAIPGGPALVICDSDEHTADGHITEDLEAHVEQQRKRMRKHEAMTAEALAPERYGREDAETLLLTWGSTYGPAREAVDMLVERGASVAMLHFSQVWPMNSDMAREAIGSPHRVVCVEANQTGQFAALLRSLGALDKCDLVTNYTGLPFTAVEIAERIAQ